MPEPHARSDTDLRRQMEATLDHYHALGDGLLVEAGVTFLVDPARPDVYDANHARHVRASGQEEIEALLARMDELFAASAHRRILVDLDTPDVVEARLSLDGWGLDASLQHLLQGSLRRDPAEPAGLDIRLADDDASWQVMGELTRLDHVEEADKAGRLPWPVELTEQMVSHRRLKGPEVRAWIASIDGADVGMLSSMPGVDGVGLVEHLFVRPGARRQGAAQALIAHCVADARSRGATDVIIGSDPHDWPKHLYARLGFEPRYVERAWLGFPARPDPEAADRST